MDHHQVGPDQQPWTNIRSTSATSGDKVPKIKRPRRAQGASRRQAAPHRLAAKFGPRTPVTLTLRIRTGADIWLEVITDQGRFFCRFDCSAFALVEQVIRGGHYVEPLTPALEREHRSGVANLHHPPSGPTVV